MNNDAQDFEQFMKQREDASQAFVEGDAEPLEQVATHTSPASIFGPQGDYVVGADEVNAANKRGAEHFAPGSKNRFDILHMAASNGVAYWAGIQRSAVQMKGKKDPVPMDLRVTEVFRREGDEWKLIHRHADMLKSEA